MSWLDWFKNFGKKEEDTSTLKGVSLEKVSQSEKKAITNIYSLEKAAEESKAEGKYKDAATMYSIAAKEAAKYEITKPYVKIYRELAEKNRDFAYSKDKSELELKAIGVTTAIIGLVGSAIFLSTNFTGNAIANLSQNSTNYVGVGFFLLALVGLFLCFKKK